MLRFFRGRRKGGSLGNLWKNLDVKGCLVGKIIFMEF